MAGAVPVLLRGGPRDRRHGSRGTMKTPHLRYLLGGLTALAPVAAVSLAMTEASGGRPIAEPSPGAHDAFRAQVRPLLERYCFDCHSTEAAQAGIVLDTF